MATDPAFAAVPGNGAASVSATADTSYTAPSNAQIVYTASSGGSKIEELRFVGIGTTVAGMVNVFAYDGSTYHLIDQVLVGAQNASTTAANWQTSRTYLNLWLKSGWSLRVSSTVASQLVKVVALAGDYS